ncbi:hypothetical protein [Phytopseudomonas punonensis]|uniref:Holliday junction resolvase (Hjc) n=1 Tax=Phytopseudomonas punonensis TaxID=1220495 RepID=A0A1M7KD94_9GAMM|nr:hypothetical protein [Pseudomonas punonensis]SHM63267.1 holliday junction resolvase (hjc) [Pseudomonas punonensis]
MDEVMLMDRSRVLHEALEQSGWENPEEVIQRVKRLDLGLPAEDEFAVICSWLGKCSLVHKLDQQQIPRSSRETYQVPDLLAVFNTTNNQYRVLIEVKTKKEENLTLRAKDRDKLLKYGEILGLPVLFAWKYHGFWMLFDISLFKRFNKNYRVDFFSAMSNSLMSLLAGDVSYQLGEGVGLYFKLKKDGMHRSDENVETWKARMEEVYLLDFNGEKNYKFSPKTLSILNTCEIEENTEVDDEYIRQSFVVRPGVGNMAHRAIESLLTMADVDANIHWRSLLVDESPLYSIADFQSALNEALKQKFVSYILVQHPKEYPVFIKDDDKAKRN